MPFLLTLSACLIFVQVESIDFKSFGRVFSFEQREKMRQERKMSIMFKVELRSIVADIFRLFNDASYDQHFNGGNEKMVFIVSGRRL